MSAIEYTEDQRPCLVARKPCGCFVAAYALGPNMGIEA